ncbi:MAG TPA: DUF1127 domain-containing protein [Dongiaceae bacterium]|nr:DUF1127 domain-containing protein [Dongiaceae bacterium]
MTSNSRLFFSGRSIAAGLRLIMSALDAIGALLETAAERRRQRRSLALLDQRLLRDIGLSPEAVEREMRRPLWR